jgi:hypothetical protein
LQDIPDFSLIFHIIDMKFLNYYCPSQTYGVRMKHKELKEKTIGCAYNVCNKIGFGLLESVYEKCMLIELKNAGLSPEA